MGRQTERHELGSGYKCLSSVGTRFGLLWENTREKAEPRGTGAEDGHRAFIKKGTAVTTMRACSPREYALDPVLLTTTHIHAYKMIFSLFS